MVDELEQNCEFCVFQIPSFNKDDYCPKRSITILADGTSAIGCKEYEDQRFYLEEKK